MKTQMTPARTTPSRTTKKRPHTQDTDENNDYTVNTKSVCTINGLRTVLGLSINTGRGIPSAVDREHKNYDMFHDENFQRMICFTVEAIREISKIVYPNDTTYLLQKSMAAICGVNDYKPLMENMLNIVSVLPPQSLQTKVLQAMLCGSLKREEVDVLEMKKMAISASRRNYAYLSQGHEIIKNKRTVARYDEMTVKKSVDFILSDRNIQRVSWGTKRVEIDGEEVDFPNLVRKKLIGYMMRDYHEVYFNKQDRVGNESFQKVAKEITKMDMKAKLAVDYVSGILLYDNFNMLKNW